MRIPSLLLVFLAALSLHCANAFFSNAGLARTGSSTRTRSQGIQTIVCKAQDGQAFRREVLAGIMVSAVSLVSRPAQAEVPKEILEARKALDPIEGYIKAAQWDKCRTALNNPPLGFQGPNSIKGVMEKVGGRQAVFKGIAQDVITNQRLLDTFCYNNVFVDEGRQVLGLKIDYATPRMYLKAAKDALDQFIEELSQ